jgi:hypothetical protein
MLVECSSLGAGKIRHQPKTIGDMIVVSEEKPDSVPSAEQKDSYNTALNTRNFEISLFWQRSNYFLVLNSALAIGFFNLQKLWYVLFLAVFGLIVSWLWFRVNLGSKFWQLRWEQRLSEIEKEIYPERHFFAADWDIIEGDVKESIYNAKRGGFPRHGWLDNRVLKKYSVSHHMTLLSILFMVGWTILAISTVVRLWLSR